MAPRALAPDEATLWRGLRDLALAVAPAAFAGHPEEWADAPETVIAAEMARARPFAWIEGGRALGCAQWVPDADPAATHRAWVEAVFVAPEARGRGVAAALLAALAADAAAAGRRELWLEVGLANRAALALYSRAGFRVPPPGLAPAGTAAGAIALVRFLA